MKKSKTMQIVMMRAGAEARRNKLREPGIEHIYLAILKISQMSSERIAPSSSEREAIDAEIAELQKIFADAGVDAESAYERLLAAPAKTGTAMEEERRTAAHALLERAEKIADGELTTPAVLRAILERPSGAVEMANGKGDVPPGAGEIDDDDETIPGVMPPRQEQGRKEMFMDASDNSVSGGGSEGRRTDRSDGGSQREASALAGFVMPKMPDASEFNKSALTIFDPVDDDDSEPERASSGWKTPTISDRHGRTDVDDEKPRDDEPEPPEEPEPPKEEPKKKTTTSKKEGVDLGAILQELKKRRENGETTPDEPEEAPPEKVKPEPDPKPEPPKPEPPKKKSGEGIDLAAIMRELRERRESGESDDDEPETKPDPKKPAPNVNSAPVKSTKPQAAQKKPVGTQGTGPKKTPVKTEPKREVPPPKKQEPPTVEPPSIKSAAPAAAEPKTTEFLGSTYSGGLAYAVTIYIVGVLVTVGLFWGLSLLLKRFYHPADMDPSAYEWFFLVVYMTGAYFLLRIVPGLFWQRFKPFSLFLDGLLFSAYVVVAANTFLSTVEIQTKNGDIYLKILAGILVLGALIRANGKIRMLPDTRGITKETQYWLSKLTGSPDKIFYSGALVTLFLPVVIGTVYWVLEMQPHKSVLIYFFVIGWFLLVFLPQSQTLWYSEYEYGNSRAQKKRKAACEGWMMQMILLFPIGLMLFLSLLYGWFPLPTWEIVILSFFALTYVIGTISTIINNRK
ncbi:MAG TPA: hypothetical protein P5075_02930 [Eubacteriales bacterium]|nr:hypothetical protein [Eubacteriales bacterium]